MTEGLQYGDGVLSPEERNNLFLGRDRAAIEALSKIYGDSTDDIINALHSIACRVAIGCEVDPDLFAKGLVHHWENVVRFLQDRPSAPKADVGGEA